MLSIKTNVWGVRRIVTEAGEDVTRELDQKYPSFPGLYGRDRDKWIVEAENERMAMEANPVDNLVSVSTPITADNLPVGPRWEADGACWEAIKCDPLTFGRDWYWSARNGKALAKLEPEGEMLDFFPFAEAFSQAIANGAVAYTIGIDPGSPEGDVSVRFLSGKEFYRD
jgi:hypothetical protein